MAYITTLTQSGTALLARVVAGEAGLHISRIGVGSGTSSSPATATNLVARKLDAEITGIDVENNFAVVHAQFTNETVTTPFQMTELGIFARPLVGGTYGTEILYAYVSITNSDGGTVPVKSSPIRRKLVINIFIDTATTVTATISTDDISGHNIDENAHANLWIPGAYRGDCSIAAGTKAKTVTLPKFALRRGCILVCACSTANTHASPTLNVNSTGALPIVSYGKTSLDTTDRWVAGDWVVFQYDGTRWVLLMRLGRFIPTSEKAVANGVATLASDGKVVASQLRGGFVVQASAPSDTSVLWIDKNSRMRYYDSSSSSWKYIVPTWG